MFHTAMTRSPVHVYDMGSTTRRWDWQ